MYEGGKKEGVFGGGDIDHIKISVGTRDFKWNSLAHDS